MSDDFSDAVLIDALLRGLAKQGAIAPPVSIERVTSIPRGAIGKAALIRSELPYGEMPIRKKNQ
jgi:hypothetical protein